MRKDEVKLRLIVDVHYELGRTDTKILEKTLMYAVDHLSDTGLLTGETEADVISWDAKVITIKE